MRFLLPFILFCPLSLAWTFSGIDLLSKKKVTIELKNKESDFAVLAFLSSRCPCSASHEPTLADLSKQYPAVTFVGVHANADELESEAKKHFENAKLPFPIIQDVNSLLLERYHAFKTPHVYLIASNGDILYQGGITDSHEPARAKERFLASALDDVVHQRPVRTKEGRTLGCVIARSKK
jgi:hypothetical protein